ncbi:hypothetical protein ACFW1J_20475 [Priestia aryabhattai]|uniref:hypothetical protein n=1 Tax=Priestia aryabhattai TaxID=412384 RepID=UPI0008DE5431|nr:hypothetical protein [Priestia aryabhattai]MBZ6488689.1 hypothetical protein [Priestia aryabhattai]MDH3116238.1 hypothetical protein [Priestia aryabhattai]MDH3124869.1 hypothetical protein [Priestia aryabhattai]MDH3134908.1 hypothetical protein [Priestia aryabhattai]MED4154219.1 hypothetical protein [Priestia aryabhattai]
MGYILPVTPYQSIQYANRLQKNNASFANRTWPVEKKSFDEEFESRSHSLELTPSSLQKRRKLQAAERVYSKLTNKGLVINTRV